MNKSVSIAMWLTLTFAIVGIFLLYAVDWLQDGQNNVIQYQKRIENY